MAEVKPPLPALLFCGALTAFVDSFDWARRRLSETFGPIQAESETWPFTHTDYYAGQMGAPLRRLFLAFEQPVAQDFLAEAKIVTNALEAELARMERLRQKAVCLRAKAELAEVERLKEAIARLAAAGPQVMDRWRDAEARARALSEAMSELANRYQAQEKEAQRKEGDAAQMRRRAAEWERKEVELLPQLEDMLVALKRLHQERRTAGRRRPLLVITVVIGLLLSAVFGVLAATQTPALWALCAVGVVATAGGLMTIMRDRRLTGAVQAAKDELFALFQSVGEQASDIDEMERWIETGRAGSRESRARAELLFMEATRDRAQLEELAKLMQARQQALDEALAAVQAVPAQIAWSSRERAIREAKGGGGCQH